MTKKPKKIPKTDQDFLDAFEEAGFVGAAEVYRTLHPKAKYPAQYAKLVKDRNQEWLGEKYAAITAKNAERAARYIIRLEQAFYDPSTKSTARTSIGRILLQTTGILDPEQGDGSVDSISFNVTLTEKPKEEGKE